MTALVEEVGEMAAGARNALRALALRPGAPDETVLLEHSEKSAVLRAHWSHPHRWGVVLKRCDPSSAELEAAIYADVLPRIPARVPELFGLWRGGDATWLAIEDMGDEPPSLDDDRQRALVSRWVGELHAATGDLTDAPLLADRSTDHYLRRLEQARELLGDRNGGIAMDGKKRKRVERAMELCDRLGSRWKDVEAAASVLPPAFVHADLAAENLRLVRSRGRVGVTAIDWEKAGMGTPYADLAVADPDEYARAAGVPADVVKASAWVARLLRTLSHDWASKPISKLGRWCRRIERDLAVMP